MGTRSSFQYYGILTLSGIGTLGEDLCQGHENQSHILPAITAGLVCGPLALLAVLARCFSRYLKIKRFGVDDWLSVLALIGFLVIVYAGAYSKSNPFVFLIFYFYGANESQLDSLIIHEQTRLALT